MTVFPLVLYLTSLLDSGLGSLPAPINLSVSSVNFYHVLHWEPGPGTPPGTQYKILRVKGKDNRKHSSNSETTSVKLILKPSKQTYFLTVQASYNHTLSPESATVRFTPFRDTIIGPPELSLTGCGDCIQINIFLPEADSSSRIKNNDLHAFYSPRYRVLWKKRGGEEERPYDTENSNFTLHNLQNDTEYCVQVHTTIQDNKNTKPSAWECTSTSSLEPSRVLRSLSAPVNLSVNSFNFHHVLSWDPGPGTPPGTQYTIFRVGGKTRKMLAKSTTTSVTLRLKRPEEIYYLTVEASYNRSLHRESRPYKFFPIENTKIGPPKLSLAGCGTCLQINISLPEADSDSGLKKNDIHTLLFPLYKILWKKRGEQEKPQLQDTDERSHTLSNLDKGMEYCVRVEASTRQRTHIEPSAWECAFTSVVEPSQGSVIVGTSAGLLICVGFGLVASMFFLYYTGFICNLQETLPRGLIAALKGQGYTLTPEETISDPISISPAMKRKNPTMPRLAEGGANAEEGDDEEGEEEENVYIDRAAELSSGQSSREDSGDVSRNRTPAPAGDSGMVEEPEFEAIHEGIDEDEAEAEGAEVSFIPETGGQGHITGEEGEDKEEEEEETACDISGDVNLFSVTLAALDAYEEEEEQNVRDSLTDLELLLLSIDCQTESRDQTAVVPAREHFTETRCEGTRAGTLPGYIKTCDGETQRGRGGEGGGGGGILRIYETLMILGGLQNSLQ